MEASKTGLHDINLASRKAEEAAARRFQAVEWLREIVGPLGISSQPSEREFISCLRNGLILCNAMNKIHPGAVPKVVENYSNLQPFSREHQPPPAYQYFENVRNFLVALRNLKLPAFEASDLEKENLESGSVGKVVDCILGLKMYHEWNSMNAWNNGSYWLAKSPMVLQSATKFRPPDSSESLRHLDMSSVYEKQNRSDTETQKLEDIAKSFLDHMVDSKENMDENLVSLNEGDQDSRKLVMKSFLRFMSEQQIPPTIQDLFKETRGSPSSMPLGEVPVEEDSKCSSFSKKTNCNRMRLLEMQERELWDLKALLSNTKKSLEDLQVEFQRDLGELGNQVQEMSVAAHGYQKVVAENMELYNMVQDLKGSIRVFCRVKPIFNSDTKSVIEYIGDDGSLVIIDPSKSQKAGRKSFQFNRVFGPTSTQHEVFKDIRPLIRSVMDGYNACIFAYGQTGSGKTHTMSGPSGGSTTDLGINYQALNDLFLISDRRKDIMAYEISVQMVEIYNEQVRDLLAENSSSTKLEIRSCSGEDGFSLPDATMHSVKSTSDVLNLMEIGEVNRAVSSTAMNNRSSRSHSVLTVHVRGKDTSGGSLRSCLHLVDLAGSERVDKSEVTGDRLKEAQFINRSLSCLGDVISSLAQKNSHIPYRNSKLTLLLQDSLGGRAKTLMFAHLSPEEDSFGETMSTLKFAQRVSTVELGAARSHKESGEVMQLKEQIENLKKALANKEERQERTSPRVRRLSIENCSTRKTEKMSKTERTPPRIRRLSIENCRTRKTETVMKTERTPPRVRRLSTENCSTTKTEKVSKTERSLTRIRRLSIEDCSTTTEKVPKTERSPTRIRRLSIENCSTTKIEKVSKTERSPPRVRRSSIEDCSTSRTEKVWETQRTPPRVRRSSIEDCSSSTTKTEKVLNLAGITQLKTPSGPRRTWRSSLEGSKKNDVSLGHSLMEVCQPRAPRSPTGSCQRRVVEIDGRTQIPQLQLPKTLEQAGIATYETQNQMHSEVKGSAYSRTNGKGSHIRKSLRTLGKLINGSEKRSQLNPIENEPPIELSTNFGLIKSPNTANAKKLCRRSLTGVQASGRSRRSSLGANATDSIGGHDTRRSKTPPPALHPSSAKTEKRWL